MSKDAELETAIGKDAAADVMGKLTEDGIGTLVTSFESFAKEGFRALAPGVNAPKNVFQRLADGSALWNQNGGRAYEHIVAPTELAELERGFQQRHVLGHSNGIVDQPYLNRTGDTQYRVGQRLAIKPKDVLRMAELIEKLVMGMKEDLP
jgi:hypothetical protein